LKRVRLDHYGQAFKRALREIGHLLLGSSLQASQNTLASHTLRIVQLNASCGCDEARLQECDNGILLSLWLPFLPFLLRCFGLAIPLLRRKQQGSPVATSLLHGGLLQIQEPLF
jgi:hypothetical protein